MQVRPYLFFNGRADEAVEFYRGALGAEVQQRMTYAENPDAPKGDACPGGMQLPPGWENKVMHMEIRVGETVVMLSDGMGGALNFDGFSLAVNPADEADARRKFDALAAGGQITMPLGKTFFARAFGMVQDRFGVNWMVIFE